MILIKKMLCGLLCLASFNLWAKESPYNAARKGDLNALRQYRFEGADLFIPDERGFIPYELAALHANPDKSGALRRYVEIMLWLKEYKPQKHRYGKATIKLLQAGLKALGYSINTPDGILGKNTIAAIKTYQKANELAQTGRPGPQWLGLFYQDILKDAQYKLTRLGFNTKGADGLMGKNTRAAISNYRKKNKLANPNYRYLDALLISHINHAYNIKKTQQKKVIAERTRLSKINQTRYIQAGLRTLGYRIGKIDGMFGSKTANAVKKFQKKYNIPRSGDVNKKTYARMKFSFLKETQRKLNVLGYKAGKADGKLGKKTQKAINQYRKKTKLSGNGITADLLISVDNRYDNRTVRNSKKYRLATKTASRASTKTSRKTAKKTIKKSPTQIGSNNNNNILATTNIHASRTKGRMLFNRRNNRVVGCNLAGRNIPIEWCEPFYPLPRNNYCEASFKPSNGEVINLWCK